MTLPGAIVSAPPSGGLLPLSDDEAALLYHIGRFGSDGYPIERIGRNWRSVRGAPKVYRTKRQALEAFEAWAALARARWAKMLAARPDSLILTAVGIVLRGQA